MAALRRRINQKRKTTQVKATLNSFRGIAGIGVALLAFGCASKCSAAMDLGFNQLFTGPGNIAPASSGLPWSNALFTDNGDGTVNLLLSNPHLTGVESVSDFYFNFASASTTVASLNFSTVSSSGSFTGPSFVKDQDNLKADGDGKYDFTIDFASGSNNAQTFGVGDTLLLKISSANPASNPIHAVDFNSLSVSSGGQGPYLAAAHIQNTPNSAGANSAWVAANEMSVVPEPNFGFAAGLFAVGAVLARMCLKRPSYSIA